MSFQDWNKYLDEIATSKKLDVNSVKTKLVDCGEPGFTGETVSLRQHQNQSESCLISENCQKCCSGPTDRHIKVMTGEG